MVSTVAVAVAGVINIDDLVKANEPSDGSDTPISPSDESTYTGNSDKSDRKTEDKPASDNSAQEPEPSKEQGPVAEEVAEADRVRAELFDENPDQDVETA